MQKDKVINNGPESLTDILTESEKAADEIVGLEHINEDDDEIVEKPYDPDSIRINHKFFSVFQVYKWMSSDPPKITINPSFQRHLVWKPQKKSLLIESLMLNIPIPSFYFFEDENEHKNVIDGLQRLSTIREYLRGDFALSGLQYLGDRCNRKKFNDLDQKYKSRIEDTQLSINILDSRTPSLVIFDVFTRINTGGVPLNPQEIRNALARENTRELLRDMTKTDAFIKAVRGLVKDTRMDAQELCLRFITFYRAYNIKDKVPKKNKQLAKMLDECVDYLNSCDNSTLTNYLDLFEMAMKKSIAAFGKFAFTKTNKHIINKVLFTSWSVVLAHSAYSCETLLKHQDNLIKSLYNTFDTDSEYFNSITTSTATKKNIDKQFYTAHQILEDTINANNSEHEELQMLQ